MEPPFYNIDPSINKVGSVGVKEEAHSVAYVLSSPFPSCAVRNDDATY